MSKLLREVYKAEHFCRRRVGSESILACYVTFTGPASSLNRNDAGQFCRHRFGTESILASMRLVSAI